MSSWSVTLLYNVVRLLALSVPRCNVAGMVFVCASLSKKLLRYAQDWLSMAILSSSLLISTGGWVIYRLMYVAISVHFRSSLPRLVFLELWNFMLGGGLCVVI